MDTDTRAVILAYLDDAESAIRSARALLIPPSANRADAIMAALNATSAALTLREIATATGDDINALGSTLTTLYRAGRVTRERIRRDKTASTFYAYRPASPHRGAGNGERGW
jgi:hypothetical protein